MSMIIAGWTWRKNTLITVGAAVVSGAIGFGAGVWSNQPTPPWIEFGSVEATYKRGSNKVIVSGIYTARKECSRKEQDTPPEAPDPLQWAQLVEGTGPEIVSYAPRPEPPRLEVGTHSFVQEIPLTEGIEPDGWKVQVTVSCGLEPQAIRSLPARVKYTDRNGE